MGTTQAALARALELARSEQKDPVGGLWRLRTRRLSLVVAALIAAIIAAPAYGIGRALGLFGEPAPRGTQSIIDRPELRERPSYARALRVPARTMVKIRTHDGGHAAIYARPAEDGGLCWYIEQSAGPGGSGGHGLGGTCRRQEDQPDEDAPCSEKAPRPPSRATVFCPGP